MRRPNVFPHLHRINYWWEMPMSPHIVLSFSKHLSTLECRKMLSWFLAYRHIIVCRQMTYIVRTLCIISEMSKSSFGKIHLSPYLCFSVLELSHKNISFAHFVFAFFLFFYLSLSLSTSFFISISPLSSQSDTTQWSHQGSERRTSVQEQLSIDALRKVCSLNQPVS